MRNKTIEPMKSVPRAAEPVHLNGDCTPEKLETVFKTAEDLDSVLCESLEAAERILGRLWGVGPACESDPKCSPGHLVSRLNDSLCCASRLRKVLANIESAVGGPQ